MTTTQPPNRPGDADPALIGKVRKLLAMAERSSNPNEADAFSRKAAELIAAHRIDPDRVRETSHDDLSVMEVELGRGAYVRGRLSLLSAIAVANGCKTVFEVQSRGTVAMVAGFRSDLATVRCSTTRSTPKQHSGWQPSGEAPGPPPSSGGDRSCSGTPTRSGACSTRRRRPLSVTSTRRVRPCPRFGPSTGKSRSSSRQRFGRVVAARRPRAATAPGFVAGQQAAERADLGRRRVRGLRSIGRAT